MTEQEQVENGVRFLNTSPEVPKDWYKRIDLVNFNMSKLEDCILGQVRTMIHGVDWCLYNRFGSYESHLGFDITSYKNEEENFTRLEEAWINKIEEMRRTDELFE